MIYQDYFLVETYLKIFFEEVETAKVNYDVKQTFQVHSMRNACIHHCANIKRYVNVWHVDFIRKFLKIYHILMDGTVISNLRVNGWQVGLDSFLHHKDSCYSCLKLPTFEVRYSLIIVLPRRNKICLMCFYPFRQKKQETLIGSLSYQLDLCWCWHLRKTNDDCFKWKTFPFVTA